MVISILLFGGNFIKLYKQFLFGNKNLIYASKNMFSLPKISNEQLIAVDKLMTCNLIINSVAGSGKTTTILHIAKANPGKDILLLTYNAMLKAESRDKIKKLNLENIEAHSYHSFCFQYIGKGCHEDTSIVKYLKREDGYIKTAFSEYDIIIVDEAQDMISSYFELVNEIGPDTKLCIIGDINQNIYGFRGADIKYLANAQNEFQRPIKWDRANLTISYRITHQMANFVNYCIGKEGYIRANKGGSRPKYIISDYNKYKTRGGGYFLDPNNPFLEEIKSQINSGYGPEDIMILSYSVKTNFMKALERTLCVAEKIPICITLTDRFKDADLLKNKLLISTFHQAKGLERKCVIISGFDSSYYSSSRTRILPNECPNLIYVAITRAAEKLIIFHQQEKGAFPFLCNNELHKYCDVIGSIEAEMNIKKTIRMIPNSFSITEVIKFLPPDLIVKTVKSIKKIIISDDDTAIHLKSKTKQLFGYDLILHESVCHLTGIAIPAWFEYVQTGKMTILDNLNMRRGARIPEYNPIGPPKNSRELIYIAIISNSLKDKIEHEKKQIKKLNWIKKEHLDRAVKIGSKWISKKLSAEVLTSFEMYGTTITGCIDFIDQNTVWEIKCTKELNDTHILQLMFYMYSYIASGKADKDTKYKLLNMLTGEVIELMVDPEELKLSISQIILHKLKDNN